MARFRVGIWGRLKGKPGVGSGGRPKGKPRVSLGCRPRGNLSTLNVSPRENKEKAKKTLDI